MARWTKVEYATTEARRGNKEEERIGAGVKGRINAGYVLEAFT